ncbi:preprotein translocase SecA [Spirilliplanes yamanashiensis]|uniref:Preprotein translocase SecA n=1 Tax=Spirilliplanes yamanashiensis TaxID=42233 RepID=A0A8J3Y734_9ACTN|nr:preprotein translocase SecA [Spirilliplanes yamanashiensis]
MWFAVSKRRKTPRVADPNKKPKVRDIFVPRPFEGLADEPEWIALRELVPAASAPLRLKPEYAEKYGDRPVTLSTVLPMAWPAMTRSDGRVFVGLQRHVQSGDVSRDLAVAILSALQTEPGGTVAVPALPGEGERLQDILDDGPLDITVHEGFEYWLDESQADDPNVKASLERANASIYPTVRLSAANAAYWCRVPDKGHVRWVLPDEEDAALNALARVSGAGELLLGENTKFAGMFRAHGLLVPVWDIPHEPEAADWEAPLADFAKRYAAALADTAPLDAAARRAKQGLLGRQLTLR